MYIGDTDDNRVRIVSGLAPPSPSPKPAGGGNIATFAGNGFEGNGGNGGPATSAQLHFPMGITPVIAGGAAPAGSVIIADSYNNELRVVSSNGE